MLCGCSCWVSLNADPAARRSRDRKQLPASEGSNCGGSTRGSRRHSLGAQTNTSESSTLQGGSLVLLSKQVASAQQGPSVRFERPDEERGLTYILCEAQFSSILASSPCCPCRRSWNAGSCGSPSCRWGRRQLEARALPASGSGAGVGSQTAPSRSLVTLSPSPVAELSTCPASRLRPDGDQGPSRLPLAGRFPHSWDTLGNSKGETRNLIIWGQHSAGWGQALTLGSRAASPSGRQEMNSEPRSMRSRVRRIPAGQSWGHTLLFLTLRRAPPPPFLLFLLPALLTNPSGPGCKHILLINNKLHLQSITHFPKINLGAAVHGFPWKIKSAPQTSETLSHHFMFFPFAHFPPRKIYNFHEELPCTLMF